MLSVEIKENDKVVATVAAPEKQFKTGSRGYFGMAKIQIGEKTLSGPGAGSRDRFETETRGEGFDGRVSAIAGFSLTGILDKLLPIQFAKIVARIQTSGRLCQTFFSLVHKVGMIKNKCKRLCDADSAINP